MNYLPNAYELEVDLEVVMVVPSQGLPHTQELFVSRVARWLSPDFYIVFVWPFRVLEYNSATLQCII